MELQGMSDTQYFKLLEETADIQYLIVNAGGMATKTAVENILMRQYPGLSRSDAHTILNNVECQKRSFIIGREGCKWLAARPEPKITDYPVFNEL